VERFTKAKEFYGENENIRIILLEKGEILTDRVAKRG
jgi:hypothetical protein